MIMQTLFFFTSAANEIYGRGVTSSVLGPANKHTHDTSHMKKRREIYTKNKQKRRKIYM